VYSSAGTKNVPAATANAYVDATATSTNPNTGKNIVCNPNASSSQYAYLRYDPNLPLHASVSRTCAHFAALSPTTFAGAHGHAFSAALVRSNCSRNTSFFDGGGGGGGVLFDYFSVVISFVKLLD